MANWQLFLFGPPRLMYNRRPVELSLRKALALLTYLSVRKQPYSRDALATLFWPESDQSKSRANLRRTLHRLNKVLGESLVSATIDTIGLDKSVDLWLDVDEFQRIAAGYLPGNLEPVPLDAAAASQLESTVDLYTDDFLAGFTLPDSPAFDEWQFFEREGLRQTLGRILEYLIVTYRQRKEFEPAIRFARRHLAIDPLHEPAHRKLMELYQLSGQRAAALRQYKTCIQVLQQELGSAPAAETTALYDAIRAKRLQTPETIVKTSPDLSSPETTALTPPAIPTKAPVSAGRSSSHPQTKYVQSGDVHIAYQVLGSEHGPQRSRPDLVLVSGFVSHLEHIWEEPSLVQFNNRLASFARLIIFDKRGVGLSDRVGYPPSLEHTMDDILAVMDAAGSERAILMGVSEGGPNCILFAATHPDRTQGLILYGTMAKGARNHDYPWAMTREQYNMWFHQITANWGGPVSIENFAPTRSSDPHLREWWAKLLRLASSPGTLKAVLEVARDIDVRHVLPVVNTPTLVLHRCGDISVRVGAGRYLNRMIPNSRYVELDGEDHWWWVGETGPILREIETFVSDISRPLSSRSIEKVLLNTILVIGHPDMQGSVHDFKTTASLPEHMKVMVRGIVAGFQGREVPTDLQDFVAVFDGPNRALQCATAVHVSARELGFPVRIGLHAGEGTFSGNTPVDRQVQIAMQVMTVANPDEVLVTQAVKDLVTGAGFIFKPADSYTFEGAPGEWRLYFLHT